MGRVQLHFVLDHTLQDRLPLSPPTSLAPTRIPMSLWMLPPPQSLPTSRRVTPQRINVLHLGPGRLRRFWRDHLPLSHSSNVITTTLIPKDWRIFWRSDLPHGAPTA
ncbi:hypothetical protein INT45_008861 [Circinella minor]|uniref:Uncharacterized protein n=1 Tax=Circinella minor TaxID=1195481 RepID=A0A8H7RTC5_9FUNG|nr:hypothetical protein INT45_008861 [Circinella minor]